MSWSLRDRQKSGQAPKETPPPPAPQIDDSLPLPSIGYLDLSAEDAAAPPPGMGALSMDLKAQGLWSTKHLDDYATLVTRGAPSWRDDPTAPLPPVRSAHEPLRAPTRPGEQGAESAGFWARIAALRRLVFRSPHEVPIGPRGSDEQS